MQQNDSSPWTQARSVARTVAVVCAFVAILFLIVALQSILALLVFAVFFAYLMAPLIELVNRPVKLGGKSRRVPLTLAIVLVFTAIGGILVFFAAILIAPITAQVSELSRLAPDYLNAARAHVQMFHDSVLQRLPVAVQVPFDDKLAVAYAAVREHAEDGVVRLLAAARFFPALLLIPLIAFFLLRDAETFRRSALELLPVGRARWRAREFFVEVNGTLAAYVRAQWLACAFVVVTSSIGFWVLGIRYPLLLGALAGAGEFLPLVGPFFSVVIAVLFAALSPNGHVLPLALFWLGLRAVQDYIVYPRLISRGVKMHPLVVILALLAGVQVAGLTGVILAIPVVAIFSVAYRHMGRNLGGEGLVAELLRPGEPESKAPVLQEKPAPSRDRQRLFGLRVLVVDNEPDACDLLVFVLQHAGAQVMVASSAREALTVLQRERPDVLVSDIGMPGEDGFDLIRQVRALAPDQGGLTPAAALTAYTTVEDRQRALSAGYQTHVGKPVDPAALISVVDALGREHDKPRIFGELVASQ